MWASACVVHRPGALALSGQDRLRHEEARRADHILRANELPGAILHLPLSQYPGIGSRMRERLAAAGVTDTAGLWAMSAKEARAVWNSIEG